MDSQHHMVLLHAFLKKLSKTPPQKTKTALARLRQLG